MTTFGGSIRGWTSEGDINAGRGPRPPWCTRRPSVSMTTGAMSACRRRCQALARDRDLNESGSAGGDIDLMHRWPSTQGRRGFAYPATSTRRVARGERGEYPEPGQVVRGAGVSHGQHGGHDSASAAGAAASRRPRPARSQQAAAKQAAFDHDGGSVELGSEPLPRERNRSRKITLQPNSPVQVLARGAERKGAGAVDG